MAPVLPDDPVSPGELRRRLDRAADRLRVLGPRWGARTGPDAAASLGAVRSCLQRLADLAAAAEDRPTRPVPELAPHALSDQLIVLRGDLLAVVTTAEAMREAHAIAVELYELT